MKTELHDLVSKIKSLENKLGKTPTRDEFIDEYKISHHQIRLHGGFTELLKASGIDIRPGKDKKLKLPPTIFDVDLETHLHEYIPREPIKNPVWPKILCIGDTHFPFTSQYVLDKIYEFAEIHQPDHIVQMGDLYDMLAHSRFPRSHNTFSPKEEERLGRLGAETMFSTLRRLCPNAQIHLIVGNHDLRPLKKVLEKVPEVEHWAEKIFRELMTFPDVKTYFDHRDELEIGGILFTHGFLTREGAHRDYYLRSIIIGHLHKLWVQYRNVYGGMLFEMATGLVGDPFSKALGYMPSRKAANFQMGFSWVDQFGPRVIHL